VVVATSADCVVVVAIELVVVMLVLTVVVVVCVVSEEQAGMKMKPGLPAMATAPEAEDVISIH